MKLDVMKKLDAWLGTPLCLALWPLTRLLTQRASSRRRVRRVLIIKCFGLGSLAILSRVIRNLRRFHPDVEITFLTFDDHKPLLDLFTRDIRVLTLRHRSLPAMLLDTLACAGHLLRRRYDVTLDYEIFSRYTQLLTMLSLAPVRVGFHLPRAWRRAGYNRWLHYNPARPIASIYLQALVKAGLRADDDALMPLRAGAEAARRIESQFGVDWSLSAGLNINASDLAHCRRWAPECFREIVNRLVAAGFTVFLTGSPAERRYNERFMASLDAAARERVINTAGRLGLEEFIALLQRLSIFITNDSGPFHLALAADCPTVSIWGPTDPVTFGPITPSPRHRAVSAQWPCSPCVNVHGVPAAFYCEGRIDCMKAVTPDMVWREIDAILREPVSAPAALFPSNSPPLEARP